MKTNNNIPAYRFQGYTDAWELRKLGDTAIEIIAGGDIDKNKVVNDGKYPIYANSQNGDGIVGYYDDFYRVKGPAVTVTGRGEVGLAKARVTDFTPVVRLLAIRSNHNHYFLENAINLHGVIVESTGVPQLTAPQLSAYRINFPRDIQEENPIGTFFSTLDRHITLHQRKLDTLKEQKKTYLKFLFPAKGQTQPALRFQGFEDDWEEVKLGDVLVEYNRKSEIENQFELLSSTNSGIEPRSGRVSGESNIGYKIIKKGMVVLSPQNLWLGNINYNAKFEIGIVSPSYKVFNIDGPNELFLATVLRLPQMFFEYAQASVQGASIVRRNLDLDLFSTIAIPLPSLPEQEAIGTFFQTLDQEIAQVEDKLASLKEMKKTLLCKLFVSWGMRSYHALPMSRSPSGTFLDCLSSQAVRREFF